MKVGTGGHYSRQVTPNICQSQFRNGKHSKCKNKTTDRVARLQQLIVENQQMRLPAPKIAAAKVGNRFV